MDIGDEELTPKAEVEAVPKAEVVSLPLEAINFCIKPLGALIAGVLLPLFDRLLVDKLLVSLEVTLLMGEGVKAGGENGE